MSSGKVLALLFWGGALAVMVLSLQRKLMYFPTHEDAAGVGTADFAPLRDEDGSFLGYLARAPQPQRVAVVFHGNGGEALHRSLFAKLFPDDVHVILAEYPGYGAKEGTPTEKALLAAGLETVTYAANEWQLPVTVMGESLGSAVAAYAARHPSTDRLALVSPFTSAVDVAKTVYWFFPVGTLMLDRFETARFLQKVEVPLAVAHGTADHIVPFRLGRQLYDSYEGHAGKQMTPLEGVGHNGIAEVLVSAPEAASFREFLSREAP